jgi:acetyltransferase-like isoleucine patch superfamily enzyme
MRLILWFLWKIWRKFTLPLRFRWRKLRLYAQGVRFGSDLIIEQGVTVHGAGELQLGRNVWLGRGAFINVWAGARLTIGDDTYIGRYSIILAHESVRIGDHCMVAPYSHVTDVNHGMDLGSPMRSQPLRSEPVAIGSDVWFGAGCSVLPGVTIGKGCVIGARAVVSKDLPEYAIAVGVPAKIVRFRGDMRGRPKTEDQGDS